MGCPCVKLPVWLFVMLKTGDNVLIVVESVALADVDPLPDTPTEFTCGDVAVPDTFTNTVIGE